MAELPILPLKTSALLADTMHMTPEEFGVYCRLLFVMWGNGGKLMDDDTELASIGGVSMPRWRKIKEKVMRPMTVIGGLVSQKRLTDTWMKVQELRMKRAYAADERWKSNRLAKSMQVQSTSNAIKTKTKIESSFLTYEPDEGEGERNGSLPTLAEFNRKLLGRIK